MAVTIKKPEIVSVLEGEGVELRQRGRRLWACCPLHTDKTPSFCVDPEKQKFKCFGCHAGGDVVDFIRFYKGLFFKEALSYLGISGDSRPARPNPQEARRQTLIKKFNVWCVDYSKWLCRILEICGRIDAFVTSSQHLEIEGLLDVYLARDIYQWHLVILSGVDNELKFRLYEDFYGRT